jgi:two-component system copper resistance phosphate regulon response regulator CusR
MRILLIEDDEKLARAVCTGLQAEGFAVDRTGDGLEGLDMARLGPYDLLILDLMLPGLGGTELLRRLRTVNTDVPILILTARDAVADKIANFEAGADDYLTKPFAFGELIVRVKALLRRGATKQANVIRIADLEIDCVHRHVRRNGAGIKLTSKEYSLLEYMAVNAGRVLSRSMIVDHVWDQSFEGLTNIVDVYVRQLRTKIDEPFEQQLIRTVRGQGYYVSDNELGA